MAGLDPAIQLVGCTKLDGRLKAAHGEFKFVRSLRLQDSIAVKDAITRMGGLRDPFERR
jgi:hypothetical protein